MSIVFLCFIAVDIKYTNYLILCKAAAETKVKVSERPFFSYLIEIKAGVALYYVVYVTL